MTLSYPEIRKLALKPDESTKPLYPRTVTHALSTRLIWLLQKAPFTPNQITLASLITAFLAIPFFLQMSGVPVLIGAALIETYYVLDAMDGQWARLKNQKSLTGAFFDYLINYAVQPPLLFAIGWGVYSKTENPFFLVLGFTSAFSTLWVSLIWNLRASILLSVLSVHPSAGGHADPLPSPRSIPRMLFGWFHKSMVFPWFMTVLTLTSLSAFLAEKIFAGSDGRAPLHFGFFLYGYGIIGPCVAVALTGYWILTRKLDHAAK